MNKVSTLVVDNLRLDGGAMFGAIPKTLWSRLIEPDEKNRIQMTCRLLVIENPEGILLVDAGSGNKWNDKLREIYKIEACQSNTLREIFPDLRALIFTHLHFDHCGGVSHLEGNKSVLSFPDTELLVNEEHLNHALNPGVREKASYLPENLEPIKEGKIRFTKDGEEVFPGVRVHTCYGHTRAMQWLTVETEKGTIAYPTDLCPTSHHLQTAYVMGYDLHAETSMVEKEAFVEKALAEDWIVVFEHDFKVEAGRLGRDERARPVVAETVELSRYSID